MPNPQRRRDWSTGVPLLTDHRERVGLSVHPNQSAVAARPDAGRRAPPLPEGGRLECERRGWERSHRDLGTGAGDVATSVAILRWLPRNLSFDELRKKGERFLPAEIASLWWDGVGYPFLHYVHLSTAGHLLQGYRRLHFSG